MEMKEKFKQTFDEVHAPEDLLGKVMELNMKKREFKTRNLVKAAVCVLAITTGVFAAGNGICYAATGESLVATVKIMVNGQQIQPENVKWEKNGEEYEGSIILPSEDGTSTGFFITTDENPEEVVVDIDAETEVTEDGTVEEVVVLEVDEEDVNSAKYEKKEEANSSADMDGTE